MVVIPISRATPGASQRSRRRQARDTATGTRNSSSVNIFAAPYLNNKLPRTVEGTYIVGAFDYGKRAEDASFEEQSPIPFNRV